MILQPPKAKDRDVVLQQWLKTAVSLHRDNKIDEADTYYVAILKSQPGHFHANHMLGILRRQQGRPIDAVKLIRQAVKLNSGAVGAHSDLATTLGQMGRFEEALKSYDNAIALTPTNSALHSDRGAMLFKLGRFPEAIASFDRSITLNSSNADAHYNRSATLKAQSRFADALFAINAAITNRPNYAEAHNLHGLIVWEIESPASALESFDRALAIKPDHVEALANRGSCLFELGRTDEAIKDFEGAFYIDPNNAETHFLYGNMLADLKRTSEAIAQYDLVLELTPGLSKAIFNRARQLLMRGDLAEGWEGHERRFEQPNASRRWSSRRYPVWVGQPIAGKSIVVYDEQGLGDNIQFARYLPLLVEQGAKVTFLLRSQLHPLLSSLHENVILLGSEPTGAFDFQCELLSLPRAFKTTLATIPNSVPYLGLEPTHVAAWASKLGQGKPKVGISWQGNPLGKIDAGRSIPLHEFSSLAQVADVRLISLQKNHGLDQLDNLPEGMEVETLGDGFDSGHAAFIDTAAVMMNLDLIITSDTSIAHLAGALGRPVWLALKHVPDWRWLLDRQDSPWYPTMRLYRQSKPGDWHELLERMATDFKGYVESAILPR